MLTIYLIVVRNMLIGELIFAVLQSFWLSFKLFSVRAVTSLAVFAAVHLSISFGLARWAAMNAAFKALVLGALLLGQRLCQCSFLDSIFQIAQLNQDQEGAQRALDAQWQFAFQTYGLHRPSRDGVIQIFRAVTSHIGPGNPAVLSIPVSSADRPDLILDLVERGWSDLSVVGTVVPWQLCPIDNTRAQSRNRALAYPTYILFTHERFADYEQRPHGLMEVVVPGDSWLFGAILPIRVNWPIMREFIASFCPMGLLVDRLSKLLIVGTGSMPVWCSHIMGELLYLHNLSHICGHLFLTCPLTQACVVLANTLFLCQGARLFSSVMSFKPWASLSVGMNGCQGRLKCPPC